MCPPQLILEIPTFVLALSRAIAGCLLFRSRLRGPSHGATLGGTRVPMGSLQQDLEAAQQQLLQRGQQWVVCIGLCVIVVLPA
jgi:hypothetical protein